MRLWSLHPMYLDSKGLVAVWREALLAKHVLAGKTKGYTNHPQLERFKACPTPLAAIDQYLAAVYEEALTRGYTFTKDKIDRTFTPTTIVVTTGQVDYEREHLMKKLQLRDKMKYDALAKSTMYLPHPLFDVIPGERAPWERV